MGNAIEEAICLAGTPEQWLQHEFHHAEQSRASRVLQLMRDADEDTSPQAVIMVPCYKLGSSTDACTSGAEALAVAPGQQHGRLCLLACITIRALLFKGGPCFCNTCTNDGCVRSAEATDTQLASFKLLLRFVRNHHLCMCCRSTAHL
jgi:hypothetical protein